MDDPFRQCTILHLDMDAFFASVEMLDDPALQGQPVAVGGDGVRGAVASCSYEARAYGVRSAMSMVEARRRCPSLVVVPPRLARYAEVSGALHRLLREVTPNIEPVGLDEAFLDVSGARRRLGHPVAIAHDLRREVAQQLGLSCAVGVARTKSVAKLASRRAKQGPAEDHRPTEGVFVVLPADEPGFLAPLPVSALWGVGPATAERLAKVGIRTVGDLSQIPESVLCRFVGAAAGRQLHRLSCGGDTSPVQPNRPLRSIGREQTFEHDLSDPEALARSATELAGTVGYRLAEAGLACQTVTLKVRYADRRTITRAATVRPAATGPHAVQVAAQSVLAAIDLAAGVRLLGVSASALVRQSAVVEQLALPAAPGAADSGTSVATDVAERWRHLDAVLGQVNRRFGPNAVVAAVAAATGGRASPPRSGPTPKIADR